MTIEERAEYAAELKATGQCNCTQAVLKAFEDKLPVNSEELMKLTAGFAAGMGCMERVLCVSSLFHCQCGGQAPF